MGKNSASYARNKILGSTVHIINASQAKIPVKKMQTVEYERYSGYPGGLTKERMDSLIKRKGHKEIFKLAVYGMLPRNKLRPGMMKNLKISE